MLAQVVEGNPVEAQVTTACIIVASDSGGLTKGLGTQGSSLLSSYPEEQ